MNILHVYSGNLFGGVESMLLTVAKHAPTHDFALSFEGQLSQQLRALDHEPHMLGAVRTSRPWTALAARQKLKKLLRQRRYDAVICHSAWSQAIFGDIASKGQRVLWLHNPANGRHPLERLAKRVRPDIAICNSQFTAGTLSLLYPKARAEVLYCPVEPMPAEEGSNIRRQMNVPPGGIVITQVSRMEPGKGHHLHLEALSNLTDINWTCWFVGGAQRPEESAYVDQLKQAAVRLGIAGRVRFLGQRSDISALLSATDIFCQPNVSPEAFGISFVEALYAGVPVVGMDVGAVGEIIDSNCGILCRPNDSEQLASNLRRLITDAALRKTMSEGGPMRARTLSDPQAQMSTLHSMLARL